jgi:hypothetical protein
MFLILVDRGEPEQFAERGPAFIHRCGSRHHCSSRNSITASRNVGSNERLFAIVSNSRRHVMKDGEPSKRLPWAGTET